MGPGVVSKIWGKKINVCADVLIEINFQAEPCNCNPLGSSSITCDDNTGQCNCNDNVVGIHCDQCASEYYNFPNCTSKYFYNRNL